MTNGASIRSLGLLLIVAGCATGLHEMPHKTPPTDPAAPPATVSVSPPDIHQSDQPDETDILESPREPALAGQETDDVEEVVVVGNRIRRWLPIVGAAWPDKNCELRVRTVGTGDRRSIYVADLGRSGRAWRHVARELARSGRQSVLVTLPGSDGNRPCTWRGAVLHEASRLLRDLLRESEAPVSVVGDAFGGQVALEAAKLLPDRIHNIVLYDVVPYRWGMQNLLAKGAATAYIPSAFAAQARVAPPGWWSMMSGADVQTGRDFVDEAVQTEVIKSLRRSDPVTVSYEFVRGMGVRNDLRPLIESVPRPVLALWPTGPAGKERKSLDTVAAQYAELPDVVWQTVEGHGAGAMLEAPEAVALQVQQFWDDIGFE